MAITESRSLPPQFVEDLGKDYATQLTGLTSQALDTTKFQPMVAGQDQATKDAYSQSYNTRSRYRSIRTILTVKQDNIKLVQERLQVNLQT